MNVSVETLAYILALATVLVWLAATARPALRWLVHGRGAKPPQKAPASPVLSPEEVAGEIYRFAYRRGYAAGYEAAKGRGDGHAPRWLLADQAHPGGTDR